MINTLNGPRIALQDGSKEDDGLMPGEWICDRVLELLYMLDALSPTVIKEIPDVLFWRLFSFLAPSYVGALGNVVELRTRTQHKRKQSSCPSSFSRVSPFLP